MFKDASWVVIANLCLSIHTDSIYESEEASQAFCSKRYASPLEVVYALPCRQKPWQGNIHFPDVESLGYFGKVTAKFRLNDLYKMQI